MSWSPVRAPLVEWVQNDVAALLVVEALQVLASGIVDDGGVAAFPNLAQDLHDELGLSDAGVAHDLEVLRFLPRWNSHHFAQLGRLEADAIALLLAVEFLGRKQLWATQDTSVLHLFETPDVIRNSEPEHDSDAGSALDEADGEEPEKALALVDRETEPPM